MTHVHIVTQRERKATSSFPRFVHLRERRSQKASQAYSEFPKPKVSRKHVLTVVGTLLRLLIKGEHFGLRSNRHDLHSWAKPCNTSLSYVMSSSAVRVCSSALLISV